VVVDRSLVSRSPDGTSDLEITVEAPRDDGGRWSCSISIGAFLKVRTFGETPLQALAFAPRAISAQLIGMMRRGKVLALKGAENEPLTEAEIELLVGGVEPLAPPA